MGTFGKTEITVPRARLQVGDGRTTEWQSSALRAYQRRTLAADALIAGAYLAGTNTRRVRRALKASCLHQSRWRVRAPEKQVAHFVRNDMREQGAEIDTKYTCKVLNLFQEHLRHGAARPA